MHAPERIDNNLAQGRLRLTWADTAVSLDHAALRRACRCAECQAEQRRGAPIDAPADVRVTAIAPAGYGVQLIFSDEHARGIFPWAYLASLAVAVSATGDARGCKKTTATGVRLRK